MALDRGSFILIILDLIKRGFPNLLDPSNYPEFFDRLYRDHLYIAWTIIQVFMFDMFSL
jgi:hypothetical protein